MKIYTLLILLYFFSGCAQSKKDITEIVLNHESDITTEDNSNKEELKRVEDRTEILNRLANKVESGTPLFVHVYVPLCDNEHQGIVPTTESLGNGMSLKSNLYWATSKGVKRYFKELPDWEMIKSDLVIDSNILERVTFKKTYKNSALVYIIADAYRGDRMNSCLADYFNALSGNRLDTTTIGGDKYEIASNADLLVFNGHNGLMDDHPTIFAPLEHDPKDAVAIACISGDYFKGYYEYTNSYPLVNTNHLLYPGAFIIEGIINKWAELGSATECKIAAGESYFKHKPKSGPNGSQNLFNYGWNF